MIDHLSALDSTAKSGENINVEKDGDEGGCHVHTPDEKPVTVNEAEDCAEPTAADDDQQSAEIKQQEELERPEGEVSAEVINEITEDMPNGHEEQCASEEEDGEKTDTKVSKGSTRDVMSPPQVNEVWSTENKAQDDAKEAESIPDDQVFCEGEILQGMTRLGLALYMQTPRLRIFKLCVLFPYKWH